MRSVANLDKLYEVASFLLNKRGYVVLGFPDYAWEKLGSVTYVLWNVEVEQPLKLISKTDHADWIEQGKVAAQQFPKSYRDDFYVSRGDEIPMNETSRYYRAVTD
jgi:hypothetical protein